MNTISFLFPINFPFNSSDCTSYCKRTDQKIKYKFRFPSFPKKSFVLKIQVLSPHSVFKVEG